MSIFKIKLLTALGKWLLPFVKSYVTYYNFISYYFAVHYNTKCIKMNIFLYVVFLKSYFLKIFFRENHSVIHQKL